MLRNTVIKESIYKNLYLVLNGMLLKVVYINCTSILFYKKLNMHVNFIIIQAYIIDIN